MFMFASYAAFASARAASSVDSDVSSACDIRDTDRPQQLDKRVNLFLIPGRFDDELRVRDIDDLRAKHTDETQHFLTFISSFC